MPAPALGSVSERGRHKNFFDYLYSMSIEQRKIALINWITNLEDEKVINQIEDFQKTSLDQLPAEIVKLLKISDSENLNNCVEHTNSRDILNKK